MTNRIMIFIPTYNCEKQLPRVLTKIDLNIQQNVDEILVVDNCSLDNTLKVAVEYSKNIKTKYTIFRNLQNYNLGGSIKRAFLYAIEQHYDYMIVLHGDDQADIRDFLPLLEKKDYFGKDIIIGARFHPLSKLSGYSKIRILGNRLLNMACSVITKRTVYDLIAGLNCFRIDFFKNKFFLNFPDNLTFDAHVLLYACDKQANIEYIPISWREEDQISNAKVIKQALIILKLFMKYCFQKTSIFSREHCIKRAYTSEHIYP